MVLGNTYRSVDGLVTLKVTVLSETVMCLAKGHARNAAGDGTKTDGAEAAEEAVLPRLGRLWRLGVDMLARTGEDVVEAVLPLVQVVMVNRTVVVSVCLSWGRHFDGKKVEMKE
jgi:hypothetical protein